MLAYKILEETLDFLIRNRGLEGSENWEKTEHLISQFRQELLKPLHPTEQKYPEQTKRFRELLEEEYQTHLEKNADYSAWNVNGTGLVGLTVRMWDKMARIMSLMGFDIGTGTFTGTKRNMVEDESIVDTAKDMGVYAKIFRIFSEGKWGK